MSKQFLLVLLVILAVIFVRAEQYDLDLNDVDNQEVASFQSLSDIDPNGPDNAFAEIDSHAEGDADNESELEGEADLDADADSELDAEADSEVDAETDAEMEHEMTADAEQESESEADQQAEDEMSMIEASSSWPPYRGNNQPINRHKRNGISSIECLDGDCARAVKAKKVKVGSNPVAEPKKPSKLDMALAATREEIMVRAKELHKEKSWAKKVEGLISEYQSKLNKVTTNIDKLRHQTKSLLKKKKQIQNIQVQNKLKEKLSVAQADLNRLSKQMNHIHGKENEFSDTEKKLKDTMGQLKNSLLKLRGQTAKKAAYEGIV